MTASLITEIWATYGQPLMLVFIPVTVMVLLLCGFIAAVGKLAAIDTFGTISFSIMPFGWLGGVCGFIAGSSQEAVTGAFLTGMLTIIGALVSYLFSKDYLASWRAVTPLAITALCFSALGGLTLGRGAKSAWDQYDKDRADWVMRQQQLFMPAAKADMLYKKCAAAAQGDQAKCLEVFAK